MNKMFTGISIRNDISKQFRMYGEPIMIQVFAKTSVLGTSKYDDDVTFSKSGNDTWTNGMIFPISNPQKGSFEAMLLEQGKLLADDSAVYVPGDVSFSGAAVKISIGSPIEEVRSAIWPGGDDFKAVTLNSAYIKVYTRILPTGSFIGEQ